MATTIKSAKGPMHQDIFPIIARSKDQLEKCYQQLLKFIKEKGGVDVYRIPEGEEQSLAGLRDGDIIIVPLGGKLDSKNGDLILVATFTGDARDILPNFRFKTKRKWGRENLPYPLAPKQHIDKYAEQETVKNRPDKAPPKSTSYSTNSSSGAKDIFTCDLDSFSSKVYHFMPEFEKIKKAPTPGEDILRVKVMVCDKLAVLCKKSANEVMFSKNYTAVEIAKIAWDLDDDAGMDENSSDPKRILSALTAFLGQGGKEIESDPNEEWHLYNTCLSMVKTHTEMEFLNNLEALVSKERGEVCKFTSMCKDAYEQKEMALSDDLETDQDIITDLLVKKVPT